VSYYKKDTKYQNLDFAATWFWYFVSYYKKVKKNLFVVGHKVPEPRFCSNMVGCKNSAFVEWWFRDSF